MADICGPSGHRHGTGRPGVQSVPAGRLQRAGHGAAVSRSTSATARLQHRLEQPRAERQRRVAAERAGRLRANAARRSGAGDRARRLLDRVQPQRHGGVRQHLRRQSGPDRSTRTATTRWATSSCRASRGRCSSASTGRLGPPPTCTAPGSDRLHSRRRRSIRCSATTANSVNIFDPNIQLLRTRESYSASASSARCRRTWRLKSAMSARRTRAAGRPRTGTRVNIYENGFLDEFKLAQANLQSHIAAGCGAANTRARSPTAVPAPARRRCRSTSRTSTASRARRTPATRRSTRSTNFTNTTFVGRLNPTSRRHGNAARRTICSAARRSGPTWLAAGLPSNFWVVNPLIANANVRDEQRRSRSTTRCRPKCGAGWLAGPPRQRQLHVVAPVRLAARLAPLRSRAAVDRANNVPHSIKLNGFYELPFGRGKRYGSNLNAVVGRLRRRLVGEHDGTHVRADARRSATPARRHDASTSCRASTSSASTRDKIVTMLPDDIILNTRRAYNTSATSAHGLRTARRARGPLHRPASTPGCVRVRPGRLRRADRHLPHGAALHALRPHAQEADPARRSEEPSTSRSTSTTCSTTSTSRRCSTRQQHTLFQTNTHLQDINQSYDPGGRLGQIVVRFNF